MAESQRRYKKGITLSLGMAGAMVDVYTAVEKEPSSHTVCKGKPDHPHDPTQIVQRRVCPLPECGNDDQATFELIAATSDGDTANLTKEERDAVKRETVGDSDVSITLTVHKAEDVALQTIPSGGTYWLTNHAGPTTGLDHIIDYLHRHPEKVLLGRWSPAGKPNTYQFRAFGTTLVMQQLADPESLKVQQQTPGIISEVMQGHLDIILETMVTPYDPEAYRNTFAAKMKDLIASKDSVTLTTVKGKTTATTTPVVDFAAALAAQLAQTPLTSVPTSKPTRKRAVKKTAAPAADVA